MFPEKKQQMFIDWYRGRYWDTSKETGTWEIPKIPEEEQEEDVKAWVEALKKLLWRDAKKIYIHRGWRKEDYLHLFFNQLFLNYWPTYVDKNWKPSKKHIWIDDILGE